MRSRSQGRRSQGRRAVLAGVALVATVGLAGCSDQPGSAAHVGDAQISTTQVHDASAEVIQAASGLLQVPLDPAEVNRRQVNRLVTAELIEVAAQRRNLSVSEAEVDALLRQAAGSASGGEFEAQIAASQLVPPSELRDFARAVALNQKLAVVLVPKGDEAAQADAIVEELGAISEELGTAVAARFGTWDASQLSVGLPPDDLSAPLPVDPNAQITTGDVRSD